MYQTDTAVSREASAKDRLRMLRGIENLVAVVVCRLKRGDAGTHCLVKMGTTPRTVTGITEYTRQ